MRRFTHRLDAVLSPARDERGLAESTQWALVLPTLLAVLLGVVQTGVWVHGRSVATQAAHAAADLAATGDRGAAERSARSIATDGGLFEVNVQTGQDATLVTVTVSGRVPLFFDIGQGQVSGRAVVPREQVTSP